VRAGERSPSEVVEAALARIAERDQALHAFCALDEDGARRQAKAIEQRLAAGEDVGPLAGVPIGVKDLEDAAKEAEPDPVKRETLLKQVAHMNVVQRLTLALKGNREARMILIKDPNKLVQRCVLQSPRLTDMEVEAFAKMTNLSDEVFRVISLTRKFIKSYVIMKNLVNNPKTPLDISLHLIPRLNANDLKLLTTNKNIPDTLRSVAVKMQRQRTIANLK